MIQRLYGNWVLRYPWIVLFFIAIAIGVLGHYATKLEIDASAETLLLEDDKDLAFSREVTKRYHNPNFLVLTFSPKGDLLSPISLTTIESISSDLETLSGVESVTSIRNVPLVQSPPRQIQDLAQGVETLATGSFDMELVKEELLHSEFYSNNLVSSDFKTTALMINLHEDTKYYELLEQRNKLLAKKKDGSLSTQEAKLLKQIAQDFKIHRDAMRLQDKIQIEQIRDIISQYKDQGDMFLGGVNMIANDIIGFVKNDLIIYGTSLIVILVFILWFIFRRVLWVVLPLGICIVSVIATTGVLGFFNWEVTVISSNFIALQLIITLSIVLHLIVRYRELNALRPNATQSELVLETIDSKLTPSFFAIITTIAGFGSLVLSSIEPVKHLGWMMSTGVALSLLIAFIVFPVILILLPKKAEQVRQIKSQSLLIEKTVSTVENHGKWIIASSFLIVLFAIGGAMQLIVENSFINYFKKDTAIYQGMKVIDGSLGGTTPLDIIVKFSDNTSSQQSSSGDDFFDDFEVEFTQNADDPQYWFTQDKMDTILAVHNYLDSLPEVGKVQSLASLLKTGEILNDNKPLDSITLALFYSMFPDRYKDLILSPYINIENNEARITTRIIDSNPELRRNELIQKINHDLNSVITTAGTQHTLSNLMILYNNMLQSLFDSQIKTLGLVVGILFIMFLVLFRSFQLAFIGILTNIVPISLIFGIMGWLHIPLDVMTITIAAISIGIGVDDTIHYIHRFQEEYQVDKNYLLSMKRSHRSIGYAMYYTSLVVILGFSILVLSNLLPTVYFGILTVIVMAALLLSALLLLPKLLIAIKPFS